MLVRMFVATVALMALVGCAASAGRVGVLSGGESRSYKLVAAPGSDGAPRPLVIALHGWLGTPEQMARMSGLSLAAARLGFAVVYPEGDWRSWGIDQSSPRGATDSAFLADVVADVSARIPVDPARITAVGFSNGGFMAQALACSGRVRLAGVAVVASGLAASAAAGCKPGAAVPFLLIEGTDDPVVPVNGTGAGEERILPANETLAFWATGNRCNGFDLAGADSREPSVTILRAVGRNCRGGDTEGWFVQGGGHGWPGSDVGYPEFLVGRRTSAIDATSVVVDFLLRQATAPLPPPGPGSRLGDGSQPSLPVAPRVPMFSTMFAVSDAQTAAIRGAFDEGGEFSAAIELRRIFPAVTNNATAREYARVIAGRDPPAPPAPPARPALHEVVPLHATKAPPAGRG